MTAAQRTGQNGQVFNIFMHHLISEAAQFHPGIGRLDEAKFFGLVQIVNGRAGPFRQSEQQRGQQFVPYSVLQSAKSRNKRVQSLGQDRI